MTLKCRLPAPLGLVSFYTLSIVVVLILGDGFLWRFLAEAMLIACAVMCVNVLIGHGGLVTLAQGAVFGSAAYVAAWSSQFLGANLFVMLLLGMLSGALLAALISLLSLRSSGLFFMILTLVCGQLVWEVVFRWRDVSGGADGLRGFPKLSVGGWEINHAAHLFVLASLLAIGAWYCLRSYLHSPAGLALTGLRDQPLRMQALGYQLWRIRLHAALLTGVVCGAAGSLYPFINQYISPTQVHWSFSATLIIMGVIGGIRSLQGAFLGALIYLFIQTYISSYTERWQLVIGLIFVATVLFMPHGLIRRKGS
ncbi:branched-chain amino acid ABC transporter permease [Alcaligenes endophyticus]|uniref:Branched-chain amino acid ABC transporter permease n=1 Tax=Alcaligenes endophyticus TaxID=1929088 RepID=A0ABT8ELT9_9BURK|nr:branched-chain amino acid ABC transporter permease [Alcaligenes endophyticus]MCX5591260.1 branched-chain amino acid ABC transporter permease [Alcaligenes endophyticus]MDN4122162.1 branched-chain amino acid ABC transporter permease [Alcaligenes endophyticus]